MELRGDRLDSYESLRWWMEVMSGGGERYSKIWRMEIRDGSS